MCATRPCSPRRRNGSPMICRRDVAALLARRLSRPDATLVRLPFHRRRQGDQRAPPGRRRPRVRIRRMALGGILAHARTHHPLQALASTRRSSAPSAISPRPPDRLAEVLRYGSAPDGLPRFDFGGRSSSAYQDRPEVVDIGECGSADDQPVERPEEAVGVVPGEMGSRVDALLFRCASTPASIQAPALSSLPSMPSVSQAMAETPSSPPRRSASASRNSAFRPPRGRDADFCGLGSGAPEAGFTVTVVSPPESSTQGLRAGSPWRAALSAKPAITVATARASPSIASPRMSGMTPCGVPRRRRRRAPSWGSRA